MEIKTKLGTIVTEMAADTNYPGIYLSIRRGNKTFGLCLLEVDQSTEGDEELCVHVWSPEEVWDDPLFSARFTAETVNKMFEEEIDDVEEVK